MRKQWRSHIISKKKWKRWNQSRRKRSSEAKEIENFQNWRGKAVMLVKGWGGLLLFLGLVVINNAIAHGRTQLWIGNLWQKRGTVGPGLMIRLGTTHGTSKLVDPTVDDWVGNHIGTHLVCLSFLCLSWLGSPQAFSVLLSQWITCWAHQTPMNSPIPKWDFWFFLSVGKQCCLILKNSLKGETITPSLIRVLIVFTLIREKRKWYQLIRIYVTCVNCYFSLYSL